MRLSRPNGAANHGMPAVMVVIPSMRMHERVEIGEPAIERLGEVVVVGLHAGRARVPLVVRLGESVRAARERRRRARAIDLVAANRDHELERPRSERLEVNAKAREARLQLVGRSLVANARSIFVTLAPGVVKLVGGDVDDPRRVQRSASRAAPPAHLEQILEVGLVTEDERQVDRAGVVVGELDALHQILLDELPPSQVKPQLGIVELARRILRATCERSICETYSRVTSLDSWRKLAPFDLERRPGEVAGVVVEEPCFGIDLGADVAESSSAPRRRRRCSRPGASAAHAPPRSTDEA